MTLGRPLEGSVTTEKDWKTDSNSTHIEPKCYEDFVSYSMEVKIKEDFRNQELINKLRNKRLKSK